MMLVSGQTHMDTSPFYRSEDGPVITKPRNGQFNYKYLFFVVTFCGSTFVFILINSSDYILFMDTNYLEEEDAKDQFQENVGFSVRTPGCIIPALKPINADVIKFVHFPKQSVNCTPDDYSPLLANNATHIWVLKDNANEFYNISTEDENFTCCYHPFIRPNSIEDITSHYVDDRVLYLPCQDFNESIIVRDEFVNVKCYLGENNLVKQQYFAYALPKQKVSHTTHFKNSSYNVVILGIDAVSRMNFYRTMPKTVEFLLERGAVDLEGYTKVGDNTFPNLIPVLMGLKEDELKYTCHPKEWTTFDNCPLIWQRFADAGFYTAYSEDSARLALFNYLRMGFSDSPTDYYLYTFMFETAKTVGHNKNFNSFICMGDKHYFQVQLDYFENLTSTLKDERLFAFLWEISMSHDYLNFPMYMDGSYFDFLETLEQKNYLDNTIVILMSDHGIRWGEIRNTKQGRMEERLPFVFALFPKDFQTKYEMAFANLKTNSRRLTTPFDLHETLVDLVDPRGLSNEKLVERTKGLYANNRGISLFMPIPVNRTCAIAHIADHWCTCHALNDKPLNTGLLEEAVTHLIGHINNKLKKYPQCATLSVNTILDSGELEFKNIEVSNETKVWSDFLVVIRTNPGGAIFEATVRKNQDKSWTTTGTVSRLNLYGKQSRCVDDYNTKLYCFCK